MSAALALRTDHEPLAEFLEHVLDAQQVGCFERVFGHDRLAFGLEAAAELTVSGGAEAVDFHYWSGSDVCFTHVD
jgi:hypothetical protein